MRPQIVVGGVVVGVLLGAVACSDDGADEASTPSSVAVSPSATTVGAQHSSPGDCTNRPDGSSPAEVDRSAGTYAVQALRFDGGTSTASFDVVQWLSGEEAVAAWRAEHPDDPDGPPNDYVIVDASDRLRTAPVSTGATVSLTHLATDSDAEVESDTLDALAPYLAAGDPSDTYWLTFSDDTVTDICQQYAP